MVEPQPSAAAVASEPGRHVDQQALPLVWRDQHTATLTPDDLAEERAARRRNRNFTGATTSAGTVEANARSKDMPPVSIRDAARSDRAPGTLPGDR
ncbi:hypothetical protein GCM10023191_026680 [Actinoallomurus oryzae]|jgi:hypothetical protein|uniref:Uncharacterized protein n=1 Tax=Actinoallomurus oryzae TaxID=502180 RepID=A0ABP8PU28_9ACTN